MAALTASIPRPVTPTDPGFGSLLQSEWTKLRSLRSTWIIVSLAIGLSIGMSVGLAIVAGMTFDSLSPRLQAEFDPILTTLGGWAIGMILVTVLGVTAVTAEYGNGMVRTTFIATPRRMRVFAAKAVVSGVFGMAVTSILVPGMFFVCQPIYRAYGLDTASLTDPGVIRYLLIGGLVQGAMHTLIPFAFAWLLRGAAAAITLSIGFSVLPWMMTNMVPQWVKENVLRYLPDNAKDSLLGQLEPGATLYLGDTAAAIVIAIWMVGLLAAAAVVLNRRDV